MLETTSDCDKIEHIPVKVATRAGIIPVNDLDRRISPMRERLANAAARVVESGWYILGPRVKEFESVFAAYCGVSHCVGTANGTDALELALRACGAGPGKCVVTVANAGGYSTTAILAAAAEPRYVDIDPATLLMDVGALETAITKETAAIVVTHLYGRMADMPAIMHVAQRAGVPVIEDCAQAHGARLDGRAAGSWGLFGCFSFYPTKNLGALGDGGAVVTADADAATRVRELRQYGWREKYRTAVTGGCNSRLDEMQAAILLEQLPLLDGWNERRRSIARRYSEELPAAVVKPPNAAGADFVAHLYVVRSAGRNGLRERLTGSGIQTDIHYPVPDHLQQGWSSYRWAAVSLPRCEAACAEVLTLPCFPELTDEEAAAVVTAVREAAEAR